MCNTLFGSRIAQPNGVAVRTTRCIVISTRRQFFVRQADVRFVRVPNPLKKPGVCFNAAARAAYNDTYV